jgi:hypothetical protein
MENWNDRRPIDIYNRIICYYEAKTGWIFIKFNKDVDEYVIERDIYIGRIRLFDWTVHKLGNVQIQAAIPIMAEW